MGLKLIKHLLRVFAGSHVIFVGKGSGKIMNGIKTKQKRNFTDGIFLFMDELAAFFQFHVIDVFFWCLIHIILKKELKRGSGNGKFPADFFNSQRSVYIFINEV